MMWWELNDGMHIPVRGLNSPAPRAVIKLTKCWCKWDYSGDRRCFKKLMLCLAPPCASATNGYVATKPEMSLTLSDLEEDDDDNEWQWQYIVHKHVILYSSDSYTLLSIITVFVTCWTVWNHTIPLLSNSMLALLWFH